MSLYGAMFSGVSGLNAQSQALGMISDNISNVNTVGYKTSKAAFSTLVTRQSSNFYAPGGVRSTPQAMIDRQGLLQASSNVTDIAISGNGFFVVTQDNAPTANDTRYYTRAGQFTADHEGYLTTPAGFVLQGWRTDENGVPTAANTSVLTSMESVRVTTVSGSASPTTNVEVGLNLPAANAVTGTPIDEETNVQVFDSLGVAHDITLSWEKLAANTWRVTAAVTGAGTIDEVAVGGGLGYSVDIVFDGNGVPLDFDNGTAGVQTTMPDIAIGGWTSGATDSIISFDFGTIGQSDGLTQFSSSYSPTIINQDGTQFGNFFGVTVDADGIVTALFDNGETLPIYKLALATFPNPNGLDQQTGTVFTQSERSGDFFLRQAGEANAGIFVPSSLEASTTDLANEFTNMIITQRAYAASTKIITTADEMLDELIRVKR